MLLASKSQIQRQVLADPMIEIYSCGREDVATGQIDRRVMAMLEYLAAARLPADAHLAQVRPQHPTPPPATSAPTRPATPSTSPRSTALPILGNQGRGSITEAVIQELLKLQGTMAPAQVISLMEMGGPTFAMSDHADHIHVGYTPDGTDSDGQPLSAMLGPEQWDKLLDRIGELDSPTVPTKPSKYSLPAAKGTSAPAAHIGE